MVLIKVWGMGYKPVECFCPKCGKEADQATFPDWTNEKWDLSHGMGTGNFVYPNIPEFHRWYVPAERERVIPDG